MPGQPNVPVMCHDQPPPMFFNQIHHPQIFGRLAVYSPCAWRLKSVAHPPHFEFRNKLQSRALRFCQFDVAAFGSVHRPGPPSLVASRLASMASRNNTISSPVIVRSLALASSTTVARNAVGQLKVIACILSFFVIFQMPLACQRMFEHIEHDSQSKGNRRCALIRMVD